MCGNMKSMCCVCHVRCARDVPVCEAHVSTSLRSVRCVCCGSRIVNLCVFVCVHRRPVHFFHLFFNKTPANVTARRKKQQIHPGILELWNLQLRTLQNHSEAQRPRLTTGMAALPPPPPHSGVSSGAGPHSTPNSAQPCPSRAAGTMNRGESRAPKHPTPTKATEVLDAMGSPTGASGTS